MKKFTIFGAGLMMLIVGLLNLFAPQMMMNEPKIQLTSVNHFHVIRAAYGGAYLGISTLFLLGAFKTEFSKFSLVSIAVLFSGFAFGRIFSIAIDGLPVGLYLGVLASEIFFAVLAITVLRKSKH